MLKPIFVMPYIIFDPLETIIDIPVAKNKTEVIVSSIKHILFSFLKFCLTVHPP